MPASARALWLPLFDYATKVQLFSELCKYFANYFHKNFKLQKPPGNAPKMGRWSLEGLKWGFTLTKVRF